MESLFIPHTIHDIQAEGFNMSLIPHPTKPHHYLATIRNTEFLSDQEYPHIRNYVDLLTLNSQFQVVDVVEMNETLHYGRNMYVSFTTGLEDCRLVNHQYMFGVLMDSNPKWKPDMCLCKYDIQTGNITQMTYLGDGTQAEKNWLVLNETHNAFHVLHSYNPLKVITVEKHNGSQHTIHLQKVFHLEDCEMHGGGCTYLSHQKQYLVCTRIVKQHTYQFSMWILLNEKYKVVGCSEGFRFFPKVPGSSVPEYEMVMSVLENNYQVYVSMSLQDKKVFVLQFLLKDILSKIDSRQLIQGSSTTSTDTAT